MENTNLHNPSPISKLFYLKKKNKFELWFENDESHESLAYSEEELEEEEEDDLEYFDTFPTKEELKYHEWLLKNPQPSWGLKSREKPSNPRKTCNFVARVRGIKLFVGNFTYEYDFMVLEDVSSVIDHYLGSGTHMASGRISFEELQICSGPHNTQYCMENPEQAFVEYASLRIDEAGGIVKDVEVHIGKLKLLNDFYVIDMKKDPETPLLVGRGFLATGNAVIDCKKAKIAVGEGITRLVFGVKGVDLGEEEASYWTMLEKKESYKP
nr:hypothetical protein [Tanacetum cinerariifolium]